MRLYHVSPTYNIQSLVPFSSLTLRRCAKVWSEHLRHDTDVWYLYEVDVPDTAIVHATKDSMCSLDSVWRWVSVCNLIDFLYKPTKYWAQVYQEGSLSFNVRYKHELVTIKNKLNCAEIVYHKELPCKLIAAWRV